MPNTTLLMTPFMMSKRKSTADCICDQKAPSSTPMKATPISQPPNMPIAENSAASSGIEITPPQKRGATTRAIGFTAIMSIAFSCSVVFISPISAVTAEPARLANNSAATTGPSSRVSDSATSTPKASLEP